MIVSQRNIVVPNLIENAEKIHQPIEFATKQHGALGLLMREEHLLADLMLLTCLRR